MKSLDNLPADILAEILSSPDRSFLAITLWKCGSRLLQHKLAHSVLSIHLTDKLAFSTSRWPKCLSSFVALQTLSFSINGPAMSSPKLFQQEILSLPSTLRSLVISSSDLCSCLLDSYESSSSNEKGGTVNYLDYISQRFPALTRLEVPSSVFPALQSPLFLAIAKNIRELSFPGYYFRASDLDNLASSPTMEFLDFAIDFSSPEETSSFFARFSPSIRRIYEIQICYEAENLNEIPKDLKIDVLRFSIDAPWTEGVARSCPPNVRELEVTFIDDALTPLHDAAQWCSDLPPSLSSFKCTCSILHPKPLSQLPRYLTELHVDLLAIDGWEPSDALSRLPHLTSLHITQPHRIHIDTPLPSSIISFSTSTSEGVSSIPPSQFHLLPPNLTSLNLHWLVQNIGNVLSEQMQLPSTLRMLTVHHWHENWLALLPRQLTSLSIHCLDGPDDNHLECTVDYFAYAPPALRSLVVTRNAQFISKPLSGRSFSTLSKLELLELYNYSFFDSSVLITLNGYKHLKILRIALNGLQDQHIPFIPQQLRDLEIRAYLKPEVLDYWPIAAHHRLPFYLQASMLPRLEDAQRRSLLCPDPRITIQI